YEQYRVSLAGLPGVQLINYERDGVKPNYQYIVLEIDERVTGVSRDELVKVLWAENVMARRYFYPGCHRMEPYRSYYPHAGLMLPATEDLVERVLSLPTGTAVSTTEIDIICGIIKLAIAKAPALRQRLAAEGLETVGRSGR